MSEADFRAWRRRQYERLPVRECGQRHIGICWTERFNRWWPDRAPADEYPDRSDWARLGPDGWKPRPCRCESGPPP